AKKARANIPDHPSAAGPATAGAHSSRLRATTTASPRNHDRSRRTGTPSTRPSPMPRFTGAPPWGSPDPSGDSLLEQPPASGPGGGVGGGGGLLGPGGGGG